MLADRQTKRQMAHHGHHNTQLPYQGLSKQLTMHLNYPLYVIMTDEISQFSAVRHLEYLKLKILTLMRFKGRFSMP